MNQIPSRKALAGLLLSFITHALGPCFGATGQIETIVRAVPITLNGWNADFVSENTATPFSTPWQQGGTKKSLFDAGLQGHQDGLPGSRQFTSALDSGILFTMVPTSNGLPSLTSLCRADIRNCTCLQPPMAALPTQP